MRELKFRAWNGEILSDSFYPTELIDDLCGGLITRGGVSVSWNEKGYDRCQNWEQFTGLKDKNGKEICQNDIIKDPDGNTYRIYKWYGGFVMKIPAYSHEKRDLDEIDCLVTSALSDSQVRGYIEQSCEIIGNIHENPELLEIK